MQALSHYSAFLVAHPQHLPHLGICPLLTACLLYLNLLNLSTFNRNTSAMGWFDGVSEVGSTSHHRKSSSGKHHSSSHHETPRSSSIFGLGEPSHSHSKSHSHHEKPRSSGLFGLGEPSKSHSHHDKPRGSSIFGGGDNHKHNSSRSSFFGGTSHFQLRSPLHTQASCKVTQD